VMLTLTELYLTVGRIDKYAALTDRLIVLATPIPPK